MNLPKYACLTGIIILSKTVLGQNPQFRQLYTHRAYTNPAMIGLGNYDQIQATRIASGVKAKWVGINRRLNTTYLSGDIATNENASFGLNLDATDFLSSAKGSREYSFKHFHAAATYSYLLKTKSVNYKFGLSLDLSNFSFGSANFVWGDQINEEMTAFNRQTNEPLDNLSQTNLHAAVGALALGKRWFAGVAIFNVNQPNISFYEQSPQPLYRKFIVHGGYKFSRSFSNLIFTPTVFFSSQNTTNQTAIDANFQQGNLFYGAGARRVTFNNTNANSFHLYSNFRKDVWMIGYDLDFNISLNNNSLPLSHEFSVVYLIPSKKLRKAIYQLPNL